jgi:hypothetical protein
MLAPAPIRTPPKFNQKFNQNLMSYGPEDDNFSYFSSSEEEGPKGLAEYFSDEKEDDSLDNNVQQNQDLAQRIARSPRAIKTIQALEAAIAMFAQNEPEPEYQTSEYATGNRRWKRAPSVHPVPITDLLEHEVRNKHNHNKILGDKVAQIIHQNTYLSDKIAEEYQTPSEKLKKDPIMALVTKTVSTYMLIRHSKNGKAYPKAEDFSSWGEPFFKKKE